MGKRIISGSFELPDVGRVQWTAIENRMANDTVYATVLQEAVGPSGRLSDDERRKLVHLDHRLTA